MPTSNFAFLAAATFAGVSETAALIAEVSVNPQNVFQIAQYGGTGGLIIALIFALRALWQDRAKEHENYKSDRAELQKLLAAERTSHRQEIAELRQQHLVDLEQQTNRFIEELQRQIAASEAKQNEKFGE